MFSFIYIQDKRKEKWKKNLNEIVNTTFWSSLKGINNMAEDTGPVSFITTLIIGNKLSLACDELQSNHSNRLALWFIVIQRVRAK